MFENESSPLEGHLPAFIPEGFVRCDRSLWFNQMNIGLQLFYRGPRGTYLRLELSDGAIADLMSMETQAGRTRQDMGGIPVEVTRISPGAAGQKDRPPVTIARWRRGDVYYRLQSNGLSPEDLTQMVASLPLPQP